MVKYEELLKLNWKIAALQDVSVSPYTSFGSLGNIDLLLSISDKQELKNFISLITKKSIPWLILGKGSNCIFTDQGFNGVVVLLKGDFKKIVVDESKKRLLCGSAVLDTAVARAAKRQNWAGAEFLATIPGTVGGGVYMNAGAHGYEFKDLVVEVNALNNDGEEISFNKDGCLFSYRHSVFSGNNYLICDATLEFQESTIEQIIAKEDELLSQRKQNQPIHAATWGSVFVNPANASAGKLIEDCGLKGKGFGAAIISQKHGNFIENKGKAKFQDVIKTIMLAKRAVQEKFNIELELEVNIINPTGKRLTLSEAELN